MPEQKQMKVVVCLIATRLYKSFVQPLVESICKYFLLRHKIEIHLFIDEITLFAFVSNCERVTILQELIPSYKFPEATLYRYAIMSSKDYDCDYIYYLDVDYLIVSEIDENIFFDIIAVLHPGFARMGGGSWCTDEKSNAYTFPENRQLYFAGGTQGGSLSHYYRAIKRLKREIEDDEKRGIKAEWNDEAHWNKYLSELNMTNYKILDCDYCMVEQMELRNAWGIEHKQPKIIALSKDHKLFHG